MKKKLLIGLLASLMAFSFAAACGENEKPDNSGSGVNTESSNTGSDTGSEATKYKVTLRDGNPMMGGSVQELEFEAGAALELPTLEAEGKTFKGWYDIEGNAAPATMPEEAVAYSAVWEITPYTLTIVNGETTTEIKFGVEYDFENDILVSVNDLAYVLADNLPEGTEDAAYTWAEDVPETFALQNYTFTVSEVAPVTLTLINGPLWEMDSVSYLYLAEGAKLDLPFLTAEGKIFQGWFSFSYDDEGNEIATPAPETVPAEGLTLTAVWEVIPYTITITLPNEEVVTVKIGVEDVYAEDPADEIVAYNNPYSLEFKIEDALLAYATETVVYEVELPTNAETGEVEFALQDYEFTATEAERVYTVYMPDYSTVTYKYGDAIELPTPEAIEGATFVKWVYYYNGEQLDIPATASSAIDGVAFKQVWDVTPYTLTLNNVELDPVWNEETQEWESVTGTKVITFGAMTDWEKGIEATPADLAWTVSNLLPADTDTTTYAWDKALPTNAETGEVEFALQNYEFTVVATETISLVDAVAMGAGMTHNTYTDASYYVTGTVINVANAKYGNMTIADAEGNTLFVYGVYAQDDVNRETLYQDLEVKPVVGDTVKFVSVVGNFNGAQLKNAHFIEITTPETVADVHQVLAETYVITTSNSVTEAGDVTVDVVGKTFTDVAIAWESSNTDVAAVNGSTITYTLPAEATSVTLTATFTLGEVTKTKTYTVNVAAAPAAGEATVLADFSTLAKGEQYADETVTFGDDLTVSTHNGGCHFNQQLRIYDSASNNGWAILKYSGAVTSLTFNLGYKAGTLEVYGSTDGSTWVKISDITTTVAYADQTVTVDSALGYTYVKIDSTAGTQIRIKTITATIVK
ncbi:MAG: InlB B-repeat-containing protein [Clostridia bacterium]|nr:InlB B-repeat-containing protein [Clostridia bacterium]